MVNYVSVRFSPAWTNPQPISIPPFKHPEKGGFYKASKRGCLGSLQFKR